MSASLLTAPLGAAEEADALKQMDPELHYLIEARKIDLDIIAMISHNGLEDLVTFHKWDDSPEKVREAIIKDLKLDPDASPKHRAMVARIVAAWEATGKRISARDTEEAEQRTTGSAMPKTVPKAVYLEITRTFGRVHRELPDKEQPAKSLVEKRFEQIEEGELIAETMKEIVTKSEESEDAFGGCTISADGTLKLKRGRAESTVPAKPEELRAKLKVLSILWEFVRLKFPKKFMVVGTAKDPEYSMSIWSEYADWLLGDEVYENVVHSDGGNMKYRPAWSTLLELDYQVRRRAYKVMNEENITLRKALKEAMAHEPTFRKYFTMPTSLAAGAAAAAAASHTNKVPPPKQMDRPWDGAAEPAASWAAPATPPPRPHKGQGKLATPVKKPKKQGGKGWTSAASNTTPDGRLKCFKFQREKCFVKDCPRVHVCLVCNGDHPKIRCPKKPKPTQ